MQGFINIHKPAGLTSFDVIRQLKNRLPKKIKIGHLGTLDPMATGVLPIAVGNATRIIEYIKENNKEYIAAFTLGATSDTQDAWGNISYLNQQINVDEPTIRLVLKQFTGNIEQIPPMYSAVHHHGKRLYELARQGLEVERTPRQVIIEELELLAIDQSGVLPLVTIRVKCSKGTYIRTLVHDVGEKLGTGAFLSSLVRSQAGSFHLENSVHLQEIIAAEDILIYLLPIDFPLMYLDVYDLLPEEALDIKQGRFITYDGFCKSQKVRLYFNKQLIAIAHNDFEAGILKPEKVFK